MFLVIRVVLVIRAQMVQVSAALAECTKYRLVQQIVAHKGECHEQKHRYMAEERDSGWAGVGWRGAAEAAQNVHGHILI